MLRRFRFEVALYKHVVSLVDDARYLCGSCTDSCNLLTANHPL